MKPWTRHGEDNVTHGRSAGEENGGPEGGRDGCKINVMLSFETELAPQVVSEGVQRWVWVEDGRRSHMWNDWNQQYTKQLGEPRTASYCSLK